MKSSATTRPDSPIDRSPGQLRSEKVRPWHRERLAVVYVRQSTVQQVLDHQESTRLQYGLKNRAHELGWAEDRVIVIDDDLGKSGAMAEGRAGFQRLVSEVSDDAQDFGRHRLPYVNSRPISASDRRVDVRHEDEFGQSSSVTVVQPAAESSPGRGFGHFSN